MEKNNMDMKKWDTISSVSFSQINEHIKEMKSTPQKFEKSDTKHKTIRGIWDDWELTLESSNQHIVLKCPIKSGEFILKDERFDLKDHWVKVRIRLNYYSEFKMSVKDLTATQKKGTQKNLKVKTETNNPEIDPVAELVETSFKNIFKEYNNIYFILCESIFRQYFNENLEEFHHIFLMAIINQQADQDTFQWLKPTTISYAVDVNNNGDIEAKLENSVFSVMAMTEGRAAPDLVETSSSILSNVSETGAAVFAISPQLFVEKWVFPGLMAMGIGTKDDFKLKDDGLGYTNKNAIKWDTFKDKDNKPTPATIDSEHFTVSLNKDTGKIDLEFTGLTWSISKGVNISIDYTQSFTLSIKNGTDSSGKPYTNLLSTVPERASISQPIIQVDKEQREHELLKAILEEIALVVVGALLGFAAAKLTPMLLSGIRTAFRTGAAEIQGVETAMSEDIEMHGLLNEKDGNPKYGDYWDDLDKYSKQMKNSSRRPNASLADLPRGFSGDSASRSATESIAKARWRLGFGIGLGAVLGGVVGVKLALLPALQHSQSNGKYSDLPNLDNFIANCVESVHWPNNSEFEFQSVQLCGGGLKLIGKLV